MQLEKSRLFYFGFSVQASEISVNMISFSDIKGLMNI